MTPAFAYDPAADGAGSDLLNWMQAQPQAPYWALVDVALHWARHPSRLRRAAITGHPSMPWRTRPCKRSVRWPRI